MRKKVLSILLALCMVLSLTPVASLATDQTPTCNKIEHTHTTACYQSQLICNLEESVEHTHIASCYQNVLTCKLTEHAHGENCYTVQEPTGPAEPSAYEKVVALFSALPEVGIITPETTDEEKATIMAQVQTAMDAYAALLEDAQTLFDETYTGLLMAALALNDALTGNTMVTLNALSVTLYVSSTATNDNATRAEGATYKTVMGAYAKAQSGDTIKLKDDITTPDTETRVFYKSIIIDFNGHTMNCSYNVNSPYGLCNYSPNSVLTIRDSSENKTGKMVILSGSKGEFLTTAIGSTSGGKVVIENCTIVAPAAAAEPIYTNFYALLSSGADSTAEVTGTLNVIGSWSEDSLALKGNLYAISSSSKGVAYVGENAVVNAPNCMIDGGGNPVWFKPSAAKNLDCKGTAGTVAIPLIENMTLTESSDSGMLSFLVPSDADVKLDLNGHDLSGKQINIIVGGKAKLRITNSSGTQSIITNGTAKAHNIRNRGDLTIDGNVKILNRSESSTYACIYQEGDSFPDIPSKPADYERNVAKSVLNKDVILDASYAAMYVDYSYQNSSFITINGSTLSSQKTTPMQVPNGNVTINEATFIADSQVVTLTPRIEGFFAGTNTKDKIDIEKFEFWWLENVLLNQFNNVSLTARDNGIYLDQRLQSGSDATAAFAFSNIALNKDKVTPAKTGIMNLSGKNITLSGKDTYFVCEELYATEDNYDTGKDEEGKPNPPLGHTSPAGALTITGGIFSVVPNQYVPDTNNDNIKDYAILNYTNATVKDYYLVAPWTKVGTDNKVSLYYPAGAAGTATASDDVSIVALNDTENIIPDATRVQPRHFTLSSKAGEFTGIDGLSVTAFTNGNRLTVTKTKACDAKNAYVWYGGRNVGEIIIGTKSDPTYDVGGEITGAIGKPTAYLIRDGKKYNATVTGDANPYEYVVTGVPAGIYNLVVSSAPAAGEDVTKNTITTTVLVAIINQSIAQNVVLPQKTYNSIVTTVGDNTPNVEAGGLDEMAKTVGAPDANTYVLIELKVAENESSDHADAVRAAITNDGMVKGIIMDTDVLKTVNNAAPVEITEINQSEHGVSLITAVFHLPKNLQGQDGYAIFRYHGTQVDKITETANINGEYMTVNAKKDTITARLNRFSTYSIAYSEKHTVTFDANGGSVTPDSAKTNEANKLDTLPTPTRSGYSFDGWYTAADGGDKVTIETVFKEDSTIYAHWTYNGGSPTIYYTITATADTGGTISPVGNVTVGLGESKSFTITANPDYAISDVKVDGVSKGAISTYTFTNITANHTIMATYEKIKGDLKGELTVSKTVTGGGNKNALFTFRFTFSEAGKYGYTGSKTGSISNGGRIQLKHGESVTITIPRGVTYTVVEDAATRYIPTPKSRTYTGTITATPVTANFENRYDEKYIPPEPTLTGSLKVKKTVKGDLGDKDKKFAFIVTFNADGQYRYIGSKSGVIESGDTLWLRHGEYVKILNLPEGTDYSVKERENSGYKVDASGETGAIVANDVSTAAFTNSRSGAPKTGDDNSLLGGMLTMVSGILGVATLLVLNGRKRRKNQGEGTVK